MIARDISWCYGKKTVLENVSLAAEEGECVGIAGLNGSGKSTLLGILSGILKPQGGSLSCFGHDMFSERKLFSKLIGYVPQENPLLSDLSVSDNLRLWSGTKPDADTELIASLELGPLLNRRAGKLSGGEKRRVVIACALLGGQKILIMDEPTSALDIKQREIIHRYIGGFTARKGVVIMTTHDIMEMEMCDRLYYLSSHRLIESDTDTIVQQLRKETYNHESDEF